MSGALGLAVIPLAYVGLVMLLVFVPLERSSLIGAHPKE